MSLPKGGLEEIGLRGSDNDQSKPVFNQASSVAILSQYPTPPWLAEAILDRHFSDLTPDDLLLEPSCGEGAFLSALAKNIPSFGIEIDEAKAAIARSKGHRVIVGDLRDVEICERPTVVVGNPPFKTDLIDRLLERVHGWLPEEGRAGLLLPCYALQTASRVSRYNDSWSLAAEMIPRNVFPGLECPLSFVIFTKNKRRHSLGLAFYDLARDVQTMSEAARSALTRQGGGWSYAVGEAIKQLGGRGSLSQIYEVMAPKRPTGNPHWQAQIRKVVRRAPFQPVGRGEYQLAL